MELERIVGKCLTKDAQRRYSTAADLIVDLENLADGLKERSATVMQAASGSVPPRPPPKHLRTRPPAAGGAQAGTGSPAGSTQATTAQPPRTPAPQAALIPPSPGPDPRLTAEFVSTDGAPPTPREPDRRALIPWLISAALLMALVAVSVLHSPHRRPGRPSDASPSCHRTFPPRAEDSPFPRDGRHIAYIAGADNLSLWVRDLDQEELRELSSAGAEQRPFWSPTAGSIASCPVAS